MITRGQVADLREGDVVELGFASGAIVRGPLVENRHTGSLEIADAGWAVRQRDDAMSLGLERYAETLTVVSRAPRPLYVNHPRTEPTVGDVVSQGDLLKDPGDVFVWYSTGWLAPGQLEPIHPDSLRPPLRLLVDGETGQVVPGQPDGDPLAHIAKGDPTPEGADENPTCGAMSLNWACTRKPGHVGQHIAGCGIGYSVAAVWS